jgi:C-terminal processing protease CtpA/Prc
MHFNCSGLHALALSALLMTGCGGGSSGSGSNAAINQWAENVFEPEENFVNRCTNPRTGIDPFTNQPFLDQAGTESDEKFWLRSWSHDKYLWYSEIEDRNPANSETVLDYFGRLKTEALTNSGNPKDQFHFSVNTETLRQQVESGIELSTGVRWTIRVPSPPREVRVVYVEPNSSAGLAGVQRGDLLIGVDGFDVINGSDDATVDATNQALRPDQENETHEYQFQRLDETTYTVNLSADEIVTQPVLAVESIASPSGNVGYILFNDHIVTAEQQLVDAVNQLNSANITDLVLDLRYNGGGFVYIASQLSYMIAGFNNTNNQVFDNTVFNDKHTQTNPFTDQTLEPDPFLQTQLNGSALPSLDLNRVYILTGENTCSASELIINALRGVDVEVIQIGNTTCGKPYGFYATDNCGTSYFSINFRSENAKAYGDYADGFVPSAIDNGQEQIRGCEVADDLTRLLGDANEARLATALFFRENNACPPQLRAKLNTSSADGLLLKDDTLKNMYR